MIQSCIIDKYSDYSQCSAEELFSIIKNKYQSSFFDWDILVYFIWKTESELQYSVIKKHKQEILNMILAHDKTVALEYDGCGHLCKTMFRYFDELDISKLINCIIDIYEKCREKGMLSSYFGLMRDLASFTFGLYDRLSFDDNISALNEMLSMHCFWLTGNDKFDFAPFYQIKDCKKLRDWSEFCTEIEGVELN